MRRLVSPFMLLAVLTAGFFVSAPKSASAQSAGLVSSVLNRMERNRQSLRSLKASLSMEKYNAQLRDSDRYSGTLHYVPGAGRTASIRIEWQKPQHEILAVSNDKFTLFRPRLNMAYVGSSKSKKNSAGGLTEMMYLSRQQLEARFQPVQDVMPEPRLMVIHEHRCRNVHRRDERHPLLDAGRPKLLRHLIGDVDDLLQALGVKPEVMGV